MSPDRFAWHPDAGLIDHRDPDASRAALEAMGEATWREALEWLYGQAMVRPVSGDDYPGSRTRFYGADIQGPAPAPRAPAMWSEVLTEFRERVAPATYNAQHPRSFSYFTPPPLPASISGEVLAQWVNQGVDVWHAGPIGAFVEEEVICWLRDLVGFDDRGWGVLTSGGVMANIMAMALARDIHLRELRGATEPPRGSALEGVRVYASDQTHFSIERALDLLGFPADTLRVLPSDDRFRLRAEPVATAVAEDRAAGLTPLAIAAVAGSTNTGSVDRVPELAALARDENLWLHVDAAYGGAARLSPRDAGRVPGLEEADSVTVDPHKWFFQALDIGGLLVKRRQDLPETFHREPEYYRTNRPQDEPLHWYQYSLEGTRRFRGLKLWMSWKHLGTEGFARLIELCDDLAATFADMCRESPDLEAVPPEPDLSVVCFRHLPAGWQDWDPETLDTYQTALQRALEVSGEAWVSTTILRGRTYLRAGFVNYLTEVSDLDQTVRALRDLSEGVLEDLDLR